MVLFMFLDPKTVDLINTIYTIAVYLKYELIVNTYNQTNITSVIFLILVGTNHLFIIYFQSTHNIICWQLPQQSIISYLHHVIHHVQLHDRTP